MRYNCSSIDLYDSSVVASESSSFITSSLIVHTLKKSCRVPRLSHKTWFYTQIKEARLLPQSLYNIAGGSGFLKAWDVWSVRMTMRRWNRYYSTLKNELIYQYRFETVAELYYAASEFTNEWYVHTHIMNIRRRLKRE